MKKIEKPDHLNKAHIEKDVADLAFLLWKAEMDKEIIAFWKSMIH